MVFFTIVSARGYVLCRNNTWRLFSNAYEYDDKDRIFETYNDALDWLKANKTVNIENEEVEILTPYTEEGKNVIQDLMIKDPYFEDYFYIKTKRNVVPKFLVKEEQIRILINTEYNIQNPTIALDFEGEISFEEHELCNGKAVFLFNFNELASKITDKELLIKTVYSLLLENWYEHLFCAEEIYYDCIVCNPNNRNVESLIKYYYNKITFIYKMLESGNGPKLFSEYMTRKESRQTKKDIQELKSEIKKLKQEINSLKNIN